MNYLNFALIYVLLTTQCRAITVPSSAYSDFVNTIEKFSSHRKVAGSKSKQAAYDEPDGGSGVVILPTVKISSGTVQGVTYPQSHSFYAIPYAEPPLDELRFMSPKPLDKLPSTPFDASVPNPIACMQVYAGCDDGVCDNDLSEDCLVLNVHVPSTIDLSDSSSPPVDRVPVMMYNHGGFFYAGSGTNQQDNGTFLSNATNTIVVTVNSRIGPFGFLYYNDSNNYFDGNQGLEDQRLALKWINQNIDKFGGDKGKVTIFGESSGAQATMFHVLSNKSRPYFARILMESNPAVFPYPDRQGALVITNYLMNATDCTGDIECLKNANATLIANARNAVIGLALEDGDVWSAVEPYRPLIDGVEFMEQPMDLFRDGFWSTDKDILLGTNKQELAFVYNIKAVDHLHRNGTFEAFNNFMLGEEVGPVVSEKYLSYETDEYNLTTILGVELTDMWFTCPTRALARFASMTYTGDKGIYLYDDAYPMGGPGCYNVLNNTNVCGYSFHSSELVFVFKTGPSYGMAFTENDTLVSDMFSEYWGNFAHCGNPSCTLNGISNTYTAWPIYQDSLNGDTSPWSNIYIDAPQSHVQTDYRKEMCDFWDSLGVYTAPQPSTTTPVSSATTTTTTKATTTKSTTTTTTNDSAKAASGGMLWFVYALAWWRSALF